jgi:hypothetical protein
MKYYSNGVGEHIYDKAWWRAEAHILGKPVRVELQKREKGGEFLWCAHHIDFIRTSDTCGKQCKCYYPRNGKSGCCRLASPGFVGTGEFYEITEKGSIRRIK